MDYTITHKQIIEDIDNEIKNTKMIICNLEDTGFMSDELWNITHNYLNKLLSVSEDVFNDWEKYNNLIVDNHVGQIFCHMFIKRGGKA